MKTLLFHLMSYRDLPPDFREQHPSICVTVDPGLTPPAKVAKLYQLSLDELVLGAECGFDGVCINEHHGSAYGMMPSPNLLAAILSSRTRKAAICVLGNSIVFYNPPTRVAEEFAMLDCLSNGRLIAGFPVGTPMDSAYAFGQNPSTIRQRYQEAHDLIMAAWTAERVFPFQGRFYNLRYVNALPRPLQKPHPPVWIPAGGSVETWKWCAERDYGYCYLSYYGYAAAAEMLEGFWHEVDVLGKPRNPYRAGFMQMVGVAESRAEADDLYGAAAEYFFQQSLHIDSRFVSPPGHSSEKTIRDRASSTLTKVADAKGGDGIGGIARDWTGIRDRGHVVSGNVNDVIEQLEELARSLHVGHLMTMLQFGNMSHETATRNIRLFSKRVIPALRDLHPYWPDHWWPSGCEGAAE